MDCHLLWVQLFAYVCDNVQGASLALRFASFPWLSSLRRRKSGALVRRADERAEATGGSPPTCPKWSESSLEFGNMHGRVVSMSPRLTCLMQDWGIERSAPLKCLVGVRREAAGLLKIADDIDIKTQHIEWCQLKFHRVPFGKLGSWARQCEMNNETRPALLIFYLMWNSSLLGLRGSDGGGGAGVFARHTGAQSKERSQVLFLYMHGIGREG